MGEHSGNVPCGSWDGARAGFDWSLVIISINRIIPGSGFSARCIRCMMHAHFIGGEICVCVFFSLAFRLIFVWQICYLSDRVYCVWRVGCKVLVWWCMAMCTYCMCYRIWCAKALTTIVSTTGASRQCIVKVSADMHPSVFVYAHLRLQ